MEENTERVLRTRENNINTIFELMETGAGTSIPGVKGTLWGVYNALTEFSDHVKRVRITEGSNNQEARFVNALFGTGATFKADAYRDLIKLAA